VTGQATRAGLSKDPERIAQMFDGIARRYDALNHLLSAGLDRRWRRRAIRDLKLTGRERVLDVCTGTADLAIEAATSPHGHAREVVGLDFSSEMLRLAQRKIHSASLSSRIRIARGDATCLPLPDCAADVATVAFGIRNVIDPVLACRELHRVLAPGGRLAILEFGAPRIPGIRAMYLWYFKYLLPLVGRVVSKHADAYSYLPESVMNFPAGDAFADLLRSVGFGDVRSQSLTFGIVWLYIARRSDPAAPGPFSNRYV
jgi:demethylmenaquinone methyltransferase/2-methoxy-6-polyprenyl-1,4-benzoquinol methylase